MVSGGESSGYGLLTVRENLWMFAQFYGLSSARRQPAHRRAARGRQDDAIGMNTKSSQLSTGLRQKMNIVRGFLTDPEVLFLDEPTLGLDVGRVARRARVRPPVGRRRPARAVLLTTHYMVEADELCDRVAIINDGRVLACDTPGAPEAAAAARADLPPRDDAARRSGARLRWRDARRAQGDASGRRTDARRWS